MNEITCSATGLRLVGAAAENGLRISKTLYGASSALERLDVDPRQGWHRWDTPGWTLYYSETPEAAFAETIACFRLTVAQRSTLQDLADLWQMPVSDLIAALDEEADELGLPHVGVVHSSWRQLRTLYTVQLPATGWWVDPLHAGTIAAVEQAIGSHALGELGITTGLTLSHLTSDQRELTTLVAEHIRAAQLHDGSAPLGIRFPSKWGFGPCWAYWSTTDPASLTVIAAEPVDPDNPSLQAIAAAFGLLIV